MSTFSEQSCFTHLNIYHSFQNQLTLDSFYEKPNKIISISNSESNSDVNDFPSCDEMDAFIQDDRMIHIKGFGYYIKSTQVQTAYMALPTIIKIE